MNSLTSRRLDSNTTGQRSSNDYRCLIGQKCTECDVFQPIRPNPVQYYDTELPQSFTCLDCNSVCRVIRAIEYPKTNTHKRLACIRCPYPSCGIFTPYKPFTECLSSLPSDRSRIGHFQCSASNCSGWIAPTKWEQPQFSYIVDEDQEHRYLDFNKEPALKASNFIGYLERFFEVHKSNALDAQHFQISACIERSDGRPEQLEFKINNHFGDLLTTIDTIPEFESKLEILCLKEEEEAFLQFLCTKCGVNEKLILMVGAHLLDVLQYGYSDWEGESLQHTTNEASDKKVERRQHHLDAGANFMNRCGELTGKNILPDEEEGAPISFLLFQLASLTLEIGGTGKPMTEGRERLKQYAEPEFYGGFFWDEVDRFCEHLRELYPHWQEWADRAAEKNKAFD